MDSLRAMIDKRKKIWSERGDRHYDEALVCAGVRKILGSEALRTEILERPYLLIEATFSVVNKERQTVPFFFNEVQRDFILQLEERGTERPFFILKGRQQGFTTLITAIQLSFALTRKNFSGFTVANTKDNAIAIFNDKARAVYQRLPKSLKPHEQFNSVSELFFDRLNSSWRVDTATRDVARSRTLNFVHYSEAAFYKCSLAELQAGVGNAMVCGAVQIYETTANGFNEAKELWDSESCHNLFYGWWRTEEYRSEAYENLERPDSWLKSRLALLESMGLSREQQCWYAQKYNGYLDKNLIKQEFPCTPNEAFLSSGECVFDKERLNECLIRQSRAKPPRTGYFRYRKTAKPICDSSGETVEWEWSLTEIEFVDDRDGWILLHEEPRVRRSSDGHVTERAPYALGGDTAGSGKDYFTGKVICCLDHRTAATLRRQRMDEDLYAEQMYCLGKYYHDALIGIEINYSRQPMRLLFQHYAYPNLYFRQRVGALCETTEQVLGFETTAKTKPIVIGELVRRMREDPSIEVDVQTLREMTTFVRKENGKQEAIAGQHDDLVMALAIAHFISSAQSAAWLPAEDDGHGAGFSALASRGASEEFLAWE